MAHGLDHSELASSDCEGGIPKNRHSRYVRVEIRWGGGDPAKDRRYAEELVALPAEVMMVSGNAGLEARSFAGNFQAVDYRASLNSTVICRLSRNARGRRHPATQNNIKQTTSSAYIVADASDLFVV